MEWKKENLRGLLLVVCGGIAFYSLLQNLPAVAMAVGWVLGILGPFLLGGAMAFILNVPMRAIERRLFPVRPGKQVKGRRPMALLITLLAVIGVLVLASSVIGPGIAEAVRSLAAQVPAAAERLWAQISRLEQYLPMLESLLADWNMEDWKNITQKAAELLQTWGGGILSSGSMVIGGVVSGVSTFVIALIFSFYILLQKEKLGRQGRQVLYALLPERRADRTLEILRLSSRTFSSFLSGQCLEACILGTLFVVSMTIFRMPYALLVGVLPDGADPHCGRVYRLRRGRAAHCHRRPLEGPGVHRAVFGAPAGGGKPDLSPCGRLFRGPALHLGAGGSDPGR